MLDRKNNELEEFRSHYTLQQHQLEAKCKRLEATSNAAGVLKRNGCNCLFPISLIAVAELEKEHSLSVKQREKESSEVKQATEEHERILRGHLEKKVRVLENL